MARNRHLGSSLDTMIERRLRSDPPLAETLLQEAVQALLHEELALARSLVRDVIKATIGYRGLSERTGTPETSLVRMFGSGGNPTLANLFAVLSQLQRVVGIELRVSAQTQRRPRRTSRRVTARRAA